MRLIEIDGVGHPWVNLKRGSSGATAQRRQATRHLGWPGSSTGEVAGPRRTALRARGTSGRGPRGKTEEKEDGPSRLHEGGPKQGSDFHQRGRTERAREPGTDLHAEGAWEAACCDSGPFFFWWSFGRCAAFAVLTGTRRTATPGHSSGACASSVVRVAVPGRLELHVVEVPALLALFVEPVGEGGVDEAP